MKTMKKVTGLLLGLCLSICLFVLPASAAEGTLSFSDPETKVGEKVGVDVNVQSGGETIGDVHVTMKYDPAALEFVEGNGVQSNAAGELSYDSYGAGDSTEARTTIYFNVLRAGDTSIEVQDSTAYLYSDEILNLSCGNATVKASDGTAAPAAEEGAADPNAITVAGKTYTLQDGFSDAQIPEGYEKTTLQYAGQERTFVKNAEGTVFLGYLTDAAGEGGFFLYDQENAAFSPYVQIDLSDSNYMVLLTNVDSIKLPEEYQTITFTYNGIEFPAWKNTAHEGYSVVYGMNNQGAKSLYQYDEQEGTFQRTVIEEKKDSTPEKTSLVDKIKNKIGNFIDVLFVVILALLAIFVIVLIVVATKLNHRNLELDDWYDKYGSEDDKPQTKKQSKAAKRKDVDSYYDDDDYYDDDEYDDDDYDDNDQYDYDDDDDYYYDDEDDSDDYYDDDDDYDYDDSDDDIDFIDL